MIQNQGPEFRSSTARRLYQGAETGSRPELEELFKALRAEIKEYTRQVIVEPLDLEVALIFHREHRVFLVVDALDEAAPNVSPGLYEMLHALASDKVSILLTSQRPEDELCATIQIQCDECKREAVKIYSWCPICEEGSYYLCQDCIDKGVHCKDREHKLEEQEEILVDIEPSAEEMKCFVMRELEAQGKPGFSGRRDIHVSTYGTTPLGRLLKSQPSLKMEILDSVVAKANGMFALAGLYLNSLGSLGLSESEILVMLEKPPEGYFGFYEQYMERICAVGHSDPFGRGASLGIRVLSWVFCTKRLMSLVELQHALAVDVKKPGLFKLDAIYDKATIITVTAGLVTIDSNGTNGSEVVRPNHLSAQQYFDETRDRWFPDVSAEIAKVALHYISLPWLAKPCDNDWEDQEFEIRRRDYPFLEYAYSFWGDHVAEAGSDPAVHTAVMQYVSDQNKVAAFIQAAWCLSSDATAEWDVRKGANGLHVAAWFGLTLVIKDLLHQGIDVDSKDPKYGQTPLMYACRRGQKAAVRLLLEHGANANMYSHRGSCPIHEAVNARNLDVLQVLLENDEMDVNAPHLMKDGMTALAIAAHENDPEIAIALLQQDNVEINSEDLKGITALSHAIAVAGIEVAECILDHKGRDVILDAKDWKGSTALSLAAENGMDDLVIKLLSKGADPSIKDDQGGGTAILRAVDGNQLSTVRIMLEHGVDINCLDDQDRGLLHGAATGGRDEIVQLLLDKGLDPNCIDKRGKTPLHDASRGGYFTTVRTLLDGGAKYWLKDRTGRTPWTVAWHNGHIPVLKVLEKRNLADKYDQSDEYPNAKELPIWSLASLAMEELIARAIANRGGEIWHLDPENNNTALHCAVLSNNTKIAQMLLDVRMSPDAKNDYLRTPLHLAALKGYIEIMRLLLNNDGIEGNGVNSKDKWGSRPIELAYSIGHFECCLLLIGAGATIPSSMQSGKQSLFFLAIEFGHLDAVIKLVDMGADVQAKNVLGLTGIQLAQDGGKRDVENYLKKNKSVWVNSVDPGVTPNKKKMASMTLKQSPFHRPEAWDEQEGEYADLKGPSSIGALTESTALQQLITLNVPSTPLNFDAQNHATRPISIRGTPSTLPA